MNELEFSERYAEYVRDVLTPTRTEVARILDSWQQDTYWAGIRDKTRLPSPSPIHRIKSRIKRPESLVDKILRNRQHFAEGLCPESMKRVQDALGVRVVVYFLHYLPLIDNELRSSGLFEFAEHDPPIAYLREDICNRLGLSHLRRQSKESGYSSIHYILRLCDGNLAEEQRPWFELQLRTLAEDTWGEIEHILGYKPDKRTSLAVREQFRIISNLLSTIDEHFDFLSSELTRFQEEATFDDNDLLNAENLPPVLHSIGLGCAQKEIDGLLKLLFSRGIEKVRDLFSVALTRRVEMIRNTYITKEGSPATNFDIISNLANLKGCRSEQEEVERVVAQIEMMKAWYQVRASSAQTLRNDRKGEAGRGPTH